MYKVARSSFNFPGVTVLCINTPDKRFDVYGGGMTD